MTLFINYVRKIISDDEILTSILNSSIHMSEDTDKDELECNILYAVSKNICYLNSISDMKEIH